MLFAWLHVHRIAVVDPFPTGFFFVRVANPRARPARQTILTNFRPSFFPERRFEELDGSFFKMDGYSPERFTICLRSTTVRAQHVDSRCKDAGNRITASLYHAESHKGIQTRTWRGIFPITLVQEAVLPAVPGAL